MGPPLPRALAAGAGLEVGRIDLIEGRPEYLRFAAPTDLLGWLSARVVNRVPGLAWWRVLWVVAWRKPGVGLVGPARYHPWHWVPASRPGRRESAVIPAGMTGERYHPGRDDVRAPSPPTQRPRRA